jgi:hypothetical protein
LIVLMAIILAMVALGCVGGNADYAQPFTPGWTNELDRFDSRKGKPSEGIHLTGEDSAVKAKVALDEKGKPRLLIGGENAVSADVRVRGGDATLKLKYKTGWGQKKQPK